MPLGNERSANVASVSWKDHESGRYPPKTKSDECRSDAAGSIMSMAWTARSRTISMFDSGCSFCNSRTRSAFCVRAEFDFTTSQTAMTTSQVGLLGVVACPARPARLPSLCRRSSYRPKYAEKRSLLPRSRCAIFSRSSAVVVYAILPAENKMRRVRWEAAFTSGWLPRLGQARPGLARGPDHPAARALFQPCFSRKIAPGGPKPPRQTLRLRHRHLRRARQ